jgi:hypothetical protein
MHQNILRLLVLLLVFTLGSMFEMRLASAETIINVKAVMVNTTPPGQPDIDYDKNTGNAKRPGGLEDNLWVKIDKNDLKPEEAVLYLNGIKMKNVVAEGLVVDGSSSWFRYRLVRKQENQDAWQSLLARPNNFTKQVVVTVGKGEERPGGEYAKLEFINVPKTAFWVTTFGSLILLVGFILMAKKSEILRDRGPQQDKSTRRTYSLAFTQMAFWTFIVTISYCFIFSITGDLNTVSGSTLVLLGIGAVTAMTGASMDAGKRSASEENRLADIKKLEEFNNQTPKPVNQIAEIEQRLKRNENSTKVLGSKNFLDDILTDVEGAAIHRFQMVVWTLILGMVFLVKVRETLSMPQFSTELLSLMGISAGTYLGFKIPEKHTDNNP